MSSPETAAAGAAGPPVAMTGGASGERDFGRTVARLMAARWRIAWNSFRRSARWRRVMYAVVAAAVVFLALASLAVSYVMTRLIVNLVGTEQAPQADVIVAAAFTGGVMLSFMVSFTVALAALYLSRDLDLLLTAPISRRAVFASKLLGGLVPAHGVILGVTLVPLVGHGMAMGYGRGYYGTVLAALGVLPLLPVSIGAVAVVLIVLRVSAQRLGEVVGLIVVAMTLSLALVAGGARQLREAVTLSDMVTFLERLRAPYSPAEWLTTAVTAAGRGQWADAATWLGLAVVVALVAIAPLVWVSDTVYYESWLHMQSTAHRDRQRRSRLPWARVEDAAALGQPSGWFRWLSPPVVAVMRKDFRVIPRDLTSMAQVLSPLAIGVFFVLQQLLYPVRIGGSDVAHAFTTPLLVMLSGAVATGVSAMIMSRFGLTAFSLEGKAYWLVKGAPISRRELVAAKFLVAYVPYVLLGSGLIALLEVARAFSDARTFGGPMAAAMLGAIEPGLVAYAWFVMVVLGAGVVAINLAIGAARPNLRWDTPHEMLTPDVGCLSLVLYGGYSFVAGMTLALPAATSRFTVLREATSLWAVGLVLGLTLTALVVAGAWWVATGEVDAIGE